jgi:cytochrome b561
MDGIRTPAYTPIARALHWITAVLVLGLISVGIIMSQLLDSGPLQDRLYNLHRSTGVLILPLAIVRLLYRFSNPPLPLIDEIPAFQRFAAESMHWGLYLVLIVQPLVGWAATSAYRAPIVVFGLFELPPILAQNQALSEQLFAVHRVLGILMAVMVCAHAGAALYHHFIRRDRVLMRMVTGG